MSGIGEGYSHQGAPGAPYGPPGQYAPHGQARQAGAYAPPGGPAGPPPQQSQELIPAAVPAPGLGYAETFAPLERRVGRWLLAGVIALGFFAVGQLATVAVLLPSIGEATASVADSMVGIDTANPEDSDLVEAIAETLTRWSGLLAVNLSWAVMIPGAIFAAAAFGKGAYGYVMSVVGRWRWRVVARSAITIVPIFAVYISATLLIDDTITWQWNPNWALVAVVLLTTPLQSTGEEFAFRGFLTQQLAGWSRQLWVPVVAFAPLVLMAALLIASMGGFKASVVTAQVVALLAAAIGPWVSRGRPLPTAIWVGVSTGLLFGSMHGHPAFTATLQLSLVGFACSMLTYRTGGLEAASVLHVANNVFIMLPLALTGTSAISGEPVAEEDFLSLGMSIAALTLAYVSVHFTLKKVENRTVGAPGAERLLHKAGDFGSGAGAQPGYGVQPVYAPPADAPTRTFNGPEAPASRGD